jgi:Na(+)/H(+) exchange regulatory cofactor NHE-RF2
LTGLKLGDRIIEVNGVNVEGDFHAELKKKIQSVVGQVRLLVVDVEADKYFGANKTSLHNRQPFVDKIACPTLPRGSS